MNGSRDWFIAVLILFWAFCVPRFAHGQAPNAQGTAQSQQTFTLEQAVEFALKNYPAVRAALEQQSAAQSAVALTRTSYLPRADLLWQSNRATRNNVFGLLLPQAVISPISGPVLPTANGDSVWGSAAGLLFSWEPLDFGYRRAKVDAAKANQNRATTEASLTRLDVAVAVTDAFLTLLAAEQNVHAAEADVNRREVLSRNIHALAANQLRPGADASRSDAELARARINLIRDQQQQEISRAILAETLGIAGSGVEVSPGPLLGPPPQALPPAPQLSTHPLAAAQSAKVDEERALSRALSRSYYPKFDFQSTVYGRGTGANTDGTVEGGANGLAFDRSNWAVGLTVTFPLLDIFSIRANQGIENANKRTEEARYDLTLQGLKRQFAEAEIALENARRVSEETPKELEAARAGEAQAGARYGAGLATISEVADAQGLLVQAEIDDSVARLAVWHNAASVAAAEGDLEPFFKVLREKSGGGQ